MTDQHQNLNGAAHLPFLGTGVPALFLSYIYVWGWFPLAVCSRDVLEEMIRHFSK